MEILEEKDKKSLKALDIEAPIKSLNLVPILSVLENRNLKEILDILNLKGIGCVLVTDSEGTPEGIFSERDWLSKVASKNLDLEKERVGDYMTKNPAILSEEDPIAYALNLMSEGSYRHLPITKSGKIKYMLSVKDIIDHITRYYRKSISDFSPNLKIH